MVLRSRTDDGKQVIIKAYRDEPEALACFTAESAGLAFSGYGPQLLAVDTSIPLIVMSDLGVAPSLADVLLGDSPDAARSGLLSWATGYGRIAASTIGRQEELAALRSRYDRGQPDWGGARWIVERIDALPEVLGILGVVAPEGLDDDLARIAELAEPECYPVFSPGDICPDNNLLMADGLHVLDFEGSGYHPVFLDAAYARMPFATCWCVFRLPRRISAEIENAYRACVIGGYPELRDDQIWAPNVCRAMAAWTLDITVVLVPRVAESDRPMHSHRTPVPTVWQLLRYRWESLAAELDEAAELPAFAGLCRRLLAATEHWPVDQLPLYPAFAVGRGAVGR